MSRKLITLESVGSGHPDKVADLISDAILDLYLSYDPLAHVACETMVTENKVILSGEIKISALAELENFKVSREDVECVVRDTIKAVGYTIPELKFDAATVEILNLLHEQSPDINQGVGEDEGAGDQGIMYGYACDETIEAQPIAQVLANALVKGLDTYRKKDPLLYPDTKSQVTVEYVDGVASEIKTIVLAISHAEIVSRDYLQKVADTLIADVLSLHKMQALLSPHTKVIINGTGRFVQCGPYADTGLTGRKIVVDQCGLAPVGGGAFSGKDPSKVDRSGAYMARHLAKGIVKAGIASECLVGLSYCIGVSQPTSFSVNTKGTNKSKFSDEEIARIVKNMYDLSPRGIISYLRLRRPIYTTTTNYSHYGKPELPWEMTQALAQQLSQLFN